jgi:hypothetical protein
MNVEHAACDELCRAHRRLLTSSALRYAKGSSAVVTHVEVQLSRKLLLSLSAKPTAGLHPACYTSADSKRMTLAPIRRLLSRFECSTLRTAPPCASPRPSRDHRGVLNKKAPVPLVPWRREFGERATSTADR